MVRYTCSFCDSSLVEAKARARWDEALQVWKFASVKLGKLVERPILICYVCNGRGVASVKEVTE